MEEELMWVGNGEKEAVYTSVYDRPLLLSHPINQVILLCRRYVYLF